MGRRGAAPPPDEGRQLWRRGVTALESGHVDEAKAWLRQATEVSPDDGDARLHLAEALWASGARDEAIASAEAGCACRPDDARARVRVGQMRLEKGDAAGAAGCGDRAIALDARSSDAWALRGRAYAQLGDHRRAVADMLQALRFAPNDPDLLADLAQSQVAQGAPDRALTTLHQLLDFYAPGEAPPEMLAMTGQAYLDSGRPQQAAETLRMAVDRGGPEPNTLCRLAQAEAACGRTGEAIAEARRALQADAGHAESRALLARLTADGVTSTLR